MCLYTYIHVCVYCHVFCVCIWAYVFAAAAADDDVNTLKFYWNQFYL